MSVITEPVRQVRDHLAEVIERPDPTVITRHGREIAAIVPIALLRRYEALDEAELIELLTRRMASTEPGVPLEDVIAETLARDA